MAVLTHRAADRAEQTDHRHRQGRTGEADRRNDPQAPVGDRVSHLAFQRSDVRYGQAGVKVFGRCDHHRPKHERITGGPHDEIRRTDGAFRPRHVDRAPSGRVESRVLDVLDHADDPRTVSHTCNGG